MLYVKVFELSRLVPGHVILRTEVLDVISSAAVTKNLLNGTKNVPYLLADREHC